MVRTGKVLVFIAVWLLLSTNLETVHAASLPEESVERGTAAYQSGKFAEAIASYEKAIANGAQNGRLHYNLGNAYYRQNRIGHAIASYRRALIELPNDESVIANLQFARRGVVETLELPTPSGIHLTQRQLWWLTLGLSRPQLAQGFALFYCGSWLLMAIHWWRQRVKFDRSIRLTLIPSGLAALWLGIGCFFIHSDQFGKPLLSLTAPKGLAAVVIAPKAEAFAGDSETFQVVTVLHEGTELFIGERRGAWSEVVLPRGRTGWTKSEHLTLIENTN